MKFSPSALLAHSRTPEGRKQLRFAMVSAVAIAVSQTTLTICYGFFHLSETASLGIAFVTSTIASYVLNRRWVWGRDGRSHFLREVVPFWGIGFGQFLISVPLISWAQEKVKEEFSSHLVRTVGFLALNLVVYGVMWVGKYLFFNRVLFVDRSHTADAPTN